jgi:threonylcarbamoyladenosine tRNA methylthiotransferase MtaB
MSTSTSAPEVVTFGCRLNASETGAIRAAAAAGGARDAVIVNTCAVTAEAERQARQAIRRLRRERPDRLVFATGCAAQIHPAQFAQMPEVDRVVGNAGKLGPESYAPDGERVQVGGIEDAPAPVAGQVHSLESRARAYVQVQNGCDHRCTFCVIPFGRGPSRSVPLAEVAAQTRALLESGAAEIVLTGVDVTAWGADLGPGQALGDLVRGLLAAVPELTRLRLTSLDLAEIDGALWDLIATEERLLPHLHLSLQSGDDLILKRMKRRHSRAEAIAFCDRARALRPEVSLGADLIAGFSTETEAAFANTLALVGDCGLSTLHVFPYSARAGTPAARMPQVPIAVRRERAARLRAVGQAALSARLASQVGTRSRVLVEESREGAAFARADDYAPVRVDREAPQGSVLPVLFTGAEPGRLIARAAA